jgi:hypothetical protein
MKKSAKLPIKTEEDFIYFCENATKENLITAGFRIWNIVNDTTLWLIPAKYYILIPENFIVTSLGRYLEKFNKKTHDTEQRLGCLAYGIVKPNKK